MNIRLQTVDQNSSALDVLKSGLNDLEEAADELESSYIKALSIYKS